MVSRPDGRVPVMKWAEDKRDYDLAHLEDAPQHETPWVRCITRGVPGGMFPRATTTVTKSIRIPGYVMIVYEMIHDTRIIPLDGRPHLGKNIRLWNAIRAAVRGRYASSSRRRTSTTRAPSPRARRRGASAGSRTAGLYMSSSASRASAKTSSTTP